MHYVLHVSTSILYIVTNLAWNVYRSLTVDSVEDQGPLNQKQELIAGSYSIWHFERRVCSKSEVDEKEQRPLKAVEAFGRPWSPQKAKDSPQHQFVDANQYWEMNRTSSVR